MKKKKVNNDKLCGIQSVNHNYASGENTKGDRNKGMSHISHMIEYQDYNTVVFDINAISSNHENLDCHGLLTKHYLCKEKS